MTEGSPTETTQTKALPMSSIEEWTNIDVINWINKVYADKPKRQQVLVKSIEENEYTGEELLSCGNIDELMEALEISKKIIAKDLFKKMKQVKENAIADIVANSQTQLKKNQSKVKLSNTQDLDYLIKIYEGLFPIKRENDIKEDEIEDNGPIQKFVKMVKDSGHSIKEFVKSLMNFGYANNITERIIKICMKYYQLLDDTLNAFTAYGGSIKNLSRCMTEISNIFLLPVQVKNTMDKLDAKSKQKMMIKLRESTCGGLKKATNKYKLLLDKIDKVHVKNLKKLGDEWTGLYKGIMNLLNTLKAHKQSEQDNLGNKDGEKVYSVMDKLKSAAKYAGGFCLKYLAAPLTFGLGAVAWAAAVSGGIAACATGVGIPLGLGGVAAGAAAYGAACVGASKLWDKGNQLMNKGSNELEQMKKVRKTEDNIRQIELMQDSLERMANVSFSMGTVIKTELHNFEKIKEHNPHDEIQCGGFNDIDALLAPDNRILNRIQKLGESIMNSTKYLDKSKTNIEIVEATCQAELKNFGKYIHTPLLQMLTARQQKENNQW